MDDDGGVGRIAALWRYPVKSMAAEPLREIDVSWHGLTGDRRWAFVRGDVPRSDFPWLTIRERAEMWRYRPVFVDPARPDDSRVLVRTPDGDEYDVVDPQLAAELGDGVRAIKQKRGTFDAMPLSLITTQSIAAIAAAAEAGELEPRRFRPNLLVDAPDAAPFAEDGLLGRVLRVGTMRMRVDRHDERCAVVNVEPSTLERDPTILRTIADRRDSCLGVYGSIVEPGRVRLGDRVVVED